jgi:hypothetical protein
MCGYGVFKVKPNAKHEEANVAKENKNASSMK